MKKLMSVVGINDAIRAGMDPAKLGLTPVTLHRYDGATTTFLPTGEKVYVTAARTCLVANGVPCIGVTTDADIKICEGKRPSLGKASKVRPTTVVFDRKDSRLSFTDNIESAIEKAREACSAASKMVEKLHHIKEIRAKHPRLLKKEQALMRAEFLKRSEDRKAGRLRAREIADRRFAEHVYYTCMKYKMGLGQIAWDSSDYRFFDGESVEGPASIMAMTAVSNTVPYPERFVTRGRRVVREFFFVDKWIVATTVSMATEHGAEHLVEVLDSFKKEVSK